MYGPGFEPLTLSIGLMVDTLTHSATITRFDKPNLTSGYVKIFEDNSTIKQWGKLNNKQLFRVKATLAFVLFKPSGKDSLSFPDQPKLF